MLNFDEQVVIVAGAGGNAGAALARRLHTLGARLALTDQSEERLGALAEELGAPEPVTIAGADLRTEDGCARVAETALERFGRIDGLGNTVGGFAMAKTTEGAAADFTRLMELNALTALRLSAAVLPAMRERRYGRIVHIAAGAGLRAFAGGGVYSASKAALLRITEAVSEEHKADGVIANCVLPGTIDTPQNRQAMPKADRSAWVSPEEVAAVMAFLLSTDASGVTGAAVPVMGRG